MSLYPETIWESGKKCAVNKDKDVLENTSLADPSEKLESDSSGESTEICCALANCSSAFVPDGNISL